LESYQEVAESIVSVADCDPSEDQLPGCLEGMAVVLTGSGGIRPRGMYSWRGSRHHAGLTEGLGEFLSGADSSCHCGDIVVARLEMVLLADFRRKLLGYRLGCLSLAVGFREHGVRVGILRKVTRTEDSDE
jgi:hypothetical protein